MVESTQPEGEDDVGPVWQAVEEVSTTSSTSLSLGLPYVANLHSEEPDAVVPHVRICGESRVRLNECKLFSPLGLPDTFSLYRNSVPGTFSHREAAGRYRHAASLWVPVVAGAMDKRDISMIVCDSYQQ